MPDEDNGRTDAGQSEYRKLVDFRLTAIEKQVDTFRGDLKEFREDVKQELRSFRADLVTSSDHRDLSARVDKVESNITWALRIIIAIVISAVLGTVFIKGGGIK